MCLVQHEHRLIMGTMEYRPIQNMDWICRMQTLSSETKHSESFSASWILFCFTLSKIYLQLRIISINHFVYRNHFLHFNVRLKWYQNSYSDSISNRTKFTFKRCRQLGWKFELEWKSMRFYTQTRFTPWIGKSKRVNLIWPEVK